MNKIEEIDVIDAFSDTVRSWCKQYGKGVGTEDAFLIAQTAFLCAMRTWIKSRSDFLPYAEFCVKAELIEERKKNNRILRAERVFLDASASKDDDIPISGLFCATNCFENAVDFHDFLSSLGRVSSRLLGVAQMLSDNYTRAEICEQWSIAEGDWEKYLAALRRNVVEYNSQWLAVG